MFVFKQIMEHMIIAAIIINCIFCSIRGVFRRLIPDLPFGAEIFLLVCIEVSKYERINQFISFRFFFSSIY
jgi:hypothetical protein